MERFHAGAVTADQVVAALARDGGAIVEGLMSAADVARAQASLSAVLDGAPSGRNAFEGFTTQRVYAVFAKTRAFDEAALDPLVLGVLDAVLGHYQLSAPVAICIGAGESEQVLHRDQSVYPLPRDFPPVVINTMWALEDFTIANGATRYIPGSHTWVEELPSGREELGYAEMPAGSVFFYSGKLWHGGGANQTDRPRLGVILEFVVAWLRAQETQLLAVPPSTVARLPGRLQELLGYNIYPPFLGYVDGRHPQRSLEVLDE